MALLWSYLYEDKSDLPRTLFFEDFPGGYFRYGLNNEMHRCLFFQVPDEIDDIPVLPLELANIKMEECFVESKNHIVLILLNENFNSLFDDLINDIVDQTKFLPVSQLKSSFIYLCNKWFEFLQPGFVKLSNEQFKGIFAELYFLKSLLGNSKYSYNSILESWKGPFGKGHDFEFDNEHFEIKGIEDCKDIVQISSEYQLDFILGQSLKLIVFKFSDIYGISTPISDLIIEIVDLLRSQTGVNIRLFWNALNKTGIDIQNIEELNSHKFYITTKECYNASDPNFPSIKRSDLADDIRSVRYSLALSNLDSFKLIT